MRRRARPARTTRRSIHPGNSREPVPTSAATPARTCCCCNVTRVGVAAHRAHAWTTCPPRCRDLPQRAARGPSAVKPVFLRRASRCAAAGSSCARLDLALRDRPKGAQVLPREERPARMDEQDLDSVRCPERWSRIPALFDAWASRLPQGILMIAAPRQPIAGPRAQLCDRAASEKPQPLLMTTVHRVCPVLPGDLRPRPRGRAAGLHRRRCAATRRIRSRAASSARRRTG